MKQSLSSAELPISPELARAFPSGLPVTQGLIILQPADLQVLLTHAAQQAAQVVLDKVQQLLPTTVIQPEPASKELSTTEAARYLNVKPETLLTYHKQGLPFRKGRPNHYQVADLDKFCQSRRVRYSPT